MNGDLSFTVDERAALVRVTGRGMWSAERTATHFNTLDKALQRMRRQRGDARVLVDLREAAVQTAQTAEVMKQWTARIYRDVDRVAVVCATTAHSGSAETEIGRLSLKYAITPVWSAIPRPAPIKAPMRPSTPACTK